MTDDAVLSRFSAFVDLTSTEEAFLHNLHGHISNIAAGQITNASDNEPIGMFVLHRGWALSSITLADDYLLIRGLYRSCDIMGKSILHFNGGSDWEYQCYNSMLRERNYIQ